MNWEFVIGLLLPAYGAGLIWVIKTARSDPDLYWLLRKQILKVGFTLSGFLVFVPPILRLMGGFQGTSWNTIFWPLILILLILISVALFSITFFDKVARLPPKKTGSDSDA